MVRPGAREQACIGVKALLKEVQSKLRHAPLFHTGIRQLRVLKDDIPAADEPVLVQHAGKCLSENRFTGAGLADDGDGFVLINVERDTADGGEDSAADAELDLEVFDRQKYLFVFHRRPPYMCVRGSDASPRFCPTTYNTTVMTEATATGHQNSIWKPGVSMEPSAA